MTVKLIGENILTSSDFLSATEQEGEHWEQPQPSSSIAGDTRLLSKGTPADYTYSGTTTADGAVGATTLIDSKLAAFGDDLFIGATVAITDFMQDSGDYAESDTANRITLTSANLVTIADLDDDEEASLSIDKGAAYFSGDCGFKVETNFTTGIAGETCCTWALANTVDSLTDIDAASGDYLALHWKENGGQYFLKLEECNSGSLTTDTSVALSSGSYYSCIITRDESVGTYGTLYCYIYDLFAALTDTLTVTLTKKTDFRYLFWVNAVKSGGTGKAFGGLIRNFKITLTTETKTVTDFTQSTGTLTTGAFTLQVNSGTSYTLTLAYASRDFVVEMISGGDVGDATHKWSHDGGTTYLQRDNPLRATWDGSTALTTSAVDTTTPGKPSILARDDGTWVAYFGGDNTIIKYWYKYTSTDQGLTWTGGSAILVTINGAATILQPAQGKIIKLRSGRWLGISGQSATLSYVFYSDNEGTSWSHLATLGYWLGPVVEMYDGRLISVYEVQASSQIACRVSSDGGMTWGAAVTIASDTGSQNFPDIAQADNGDLICVYESDEDSSTNYEVMCKISSDYGATWGSHIHIMNYDASHKFFHPSIVKDINGTLIVACTNTTPNPAEITMEYSTDNGATWTTSHYVITTSSDDPNVIGLSLVDGHTITCLYANAAADVYLVRAGYWEAYSDAAASYTYGGNEGQHLICGAKVIWRGGNAVDGDIWTFDAAYDYAMSNVIEDSPSKPWRSTQDNIDCSIVIDLGSTERYYADGIAFFGCNIRTLKFQMNATDSWGTPSVDESVSFDLTTGACDNNPAANEIQDTSLTASYKDHELVGLMLRFTSGTLSGYTYEITDNVGSYILVNGDISTATTNDTFAIYQDHVAATFTAGIYRYMRISISAQQTADNYYQIGSAIVGRTITLSDGFGKGYELAHEYGMSFLKTGSGGITPIKNYGRKRKFGFAFTSSDAGRKQALALIDYIEGKNICLILDSTTLTKCYLVKMIDTITQRHVAREYFSAVIKFEEVL